MTLNGCCNIYVREQKDPSTSFYLSLVLAAWRKYLCLLYLYLWISSFLEKWSGDKGKMKEIQHQQSDLYWQFYCVNILQFLPSVAWIHTNYWYTKVVSNKDWNCNSNKPITHFTKKISKIYLSMYIVYVSLYVYILRYVIEKYS